MRLDGLRLLALFAALATATACAPNATREKFGDVHGGLAETGDYDIELERLFPFGLPEQSNRDVEYDPAITVEGRPGFWFNDWGGIALDGSYFQADGSGINNNIVSATPLLFVRARLFKSDGLPDGHLQPYFGIGPGVFFTDQEVDFRPDISSKLGITHISVGVDLRAGMRWRLSKNFGFFGEYRLTHYKSDSGIDGNAAFYSEDHVDSTRTTNHFMGGLSFVF